MSTVPLIMARAVCYAIPEDVVSLIMTELSKRSTLVIICGVINHGAAY